MPQKQPKNTFSSIFAILPVRAVGAMAAVFIILNACIRLFFFIYFSKDFKFSLKNIVETLGSGIVNDCATTIYMLLPAIFLLFLLPSRLFMRQSGRIVAIFSILLFTLVVVFSSCAEYFFWDEFHSRFNFIAVDYLIYTSEVINNIRESYPLVPVLGGIALLSCLITAVAWRSVAHTPQTQHLSFAKRLGIVSGNALLAILVFFLFTPISGGSDRYWQEASHNGIYELFSAFRHNTLDYRAFYPLIEEKDAFRLMREALAEPESAFLSPDTEDLRRDITPMAPAGSPNVIVVVMESMGSKWLGEYAPNLSSLARQGLFFSNMHSTGTRTVRGLEAIMLSVPPTPGNSIVRRPDNENLFTLGTVFRERGYDRDFIYGGIGYFDNMNAFFGGNGYTVTDKLDFAAQNKTFSTAWGQCDEDLYAESLRIADRSFQAGKPFHQVLLTTSNHRPFTFPEGKVDMAQGSRRAAIKYADYAIGRFMQEAKEKPWFENTVFVFIGDHPSSIAGKTEVPADAYGIVSLIYGPKFFRPETVHTLCSQIDLAPTLLASLGWEYRSQFFGSNARELPVKAGRAWISTYQLLGFRTNEQLVVLKPDGITDVTRIAVDTPEGQGVFTDREKEYLVARTVSSYQCAYDLFTRKQMKESVVIASTPHLNNKSERAVIQKMDSEYRMNTRRKQNDNEEHSLRTRGKAGLFWIMPLIAYCRL